MDKIIKTAIDNGGRAAIMDGANPTGCDKEAAARM